MPAKVAINGFGRIGRAAFKIISDRDDAEVVAVNDLTSARILAHLLRYDSAYGTFRKKIEVEEDGKIVMIEGTAYPEDHFINEQQLPKKSYLVVDGKRALVLSEKDPLKLPWKDLGIDVVLECTGRFTKDASASMHITAGAKKVVVSAPVKGEGGIPTFLKGVNHDQYLGQNVISNASCTTNCISPIVSVIHSKFKILKSAMSTIHGMTAEQNIVDGPPPGLHSDLGRARAAGFNIVPTTTGAAKATTQVLPELAGLFDGVSIRVPVIVGSLSDITMLVSKKTSVEEVNQAFIDASQNPFYKGVLDVSYEPLVSSDVIGTTASAIVDLSFTRVIDSDLVKVLAWYDNEWGYSNRLVEIALM